MLLLAGDIGGTKTDLILFDTQSASQVKQGTFASQKYKSLEEILAEFLGGVDCKVKRACFGVAGPVDHGRCHTTNLPWVIDAQLLEKKAPLERVFLLNDLEANAYGIQVLPSDQFFTLNEGEKKTGHCALISAGTGLGEAGIYFDGRVLHPFACEGGHADFAPRCPLEVELLLYLKKEFGHVSYERVLSGPGLYNIYRFLLETKKVDPATDVLKGVDPSQAPRVISEQGVKKTSALCVESLKVFASIYGAEAGNLALKFLSLGGLYLGGGIAPKILPALQEGEFLAAYKAKGRFDALLSSIPVRVVLNEDTALLGALDYARKN